MLILGISAFYHTAAACILRDGELLAAAAEERFTRIKFDPRLPVNAIRFCLDQADCNIQDLAAIAYYEQPIRKLERQLFAGTHVHDVAACDPKRPENLIRDRLGFDGPLLCFPHHLSHAASAYYFSGFTEAAVFTVDGVGEWETMTFGCGENHQLTQSESVHFPHSLGLLYAAITQHLGFAINADEYKVMGLAPYGNPRFKSTLAQLVEVYPQAPHFKLDQTHFDFSGNGPICRKSFADLLGLAQRIPESAIDPIHCDLARSIQSLTEDMLLEKVHHLYKMHPNKNLCMAGGVALNCVANGYLRRNGPFNHVFVQPAAGDDGTCLGAAALAQVQLTQNWHCQTLPHAYWGPSYSAAAIRRRLQLLDWPHLWIDDEDELIEAIAERLAAGEVIGWFHGRAEFGPRALGARSILANPLQEDMRDRLNAKVKKREAFRPFAPAVLAEAARDHFTDATNPFMLETTQVRSPLVLPGVTHVDGSARPQVVDEKALPRYRKLIQAFHRRTGCPMVVNTSFNVRGEPMVQSPDDALRCLANSGLDLLVLENALIERSSVSLTLEALLPYAQQHSSSGLSNRSSGIRHDIYTFV